MINYLERRVGRGDSGRFLAAVRDAYPMIGSPAWIPEADWYLGIPADDLGDADATRAVAYVNTTFLDERLRAVVAGAFSIIVPSEVMRRWVYAHGIGPAAHVISTGFDPGIQLRRRLPATFTIGVAGVSDGTAAVGWEDQAGRSIAGRSIRGADLVLAVAAGLDARHARFRLDSIHAQGSELARELEALGHTVVVGGTAHASRWFDEIDCLLVASRTESGPVEALNALAAGVPVVSTPVGEMLELCDMLWRTPSEAVGLVRAIRSNRHGQFARREQRRAKVARRSRLLMARQMATVLGALPQGERARIHRGIAPSVSIPGDPTNAARRPRTVPAGRSSARDTGSERAGTPSLAPHLGDRVLSILMTAWHAARWLTDAVDSVTRQELPDGWDLEILVAVDGCPETLAAASEIRDPRVVVFELAENGGTYRALNTLLQFARGAVIGILDSDDVALPGRLRAQLDRLESDPGLDYVGGQLIRTDAALATRQAMAPFPADPVARFRAGQFCYSAHGTLMARRRLYERLGGYEDTRIGGDYDLVLRALAHGMRGTNLDQVLVLRRQHPDQLTAAPDTGVGSPARRAVDADRDRRWRAYRNGEPAERLSVPARTRVASVGRPGVADSTLVVMPTVPRRRDGAKRTIEGLLGQGVDRFIVYLNGHASADGFPADRRVQYRLRPPGTGPGVRFEITATAYDVLFFIDDDIEYPHDYLARTRDSLARAGPRAVVSYHARLWAPGARRYSERSVVHFSAGVKEAVRCHYAGVGVSAMPGRLAQALGQPRPALFDMHDDLWFSAIVETAGWTIVRPATAENWLVPRPDRSEASSLYARARANAFAEREEALRFLRGAMGWSPRPGDLSRESQRQPSTS